MGQEKNSNNPSDKLVVKIYGFRRRNHPSRWAPDNIDVDGALSNDRCYKQPNTKQYHAGIRLSICLGSEGGLSEIPRR